MIDWTQIIGYLTAPVAAAVAWVFARRQRRNDAVRSMQATIDLLADKNAALHALVEQMRTEHAEENARLSEQLRQVSEENEGLKRGQEEMIEKINLLQAELEKERKKQKPKTKEQ
jgi:predicted RNase H-like nuclease (RuvC/YqgF family)